MMTIQKQLNDSPSRPLKTQSCIYCDAQDHFRRDCSVMKEDLSKQIVKLNPKGRLMDPSGYEYPSNRVKETLEHSWLRNKLLSPAILSIFKNMNCLKKTEKEGDLSRARTADWRKEKDFPLEDGSKPLGWIEEPPKNYNVSRLENN
jgi:hypothetical protein